MFAWLLLSHSYDTGTWPLNILNDNDFLHTTHTFACHM